MAMYKSCIWFVVALLIILRVVTNVYSSHFRGAVIMVKPKPGGAAKEVIHIVICYSVIIKLASYIYT